MAELATNPTAMRVARNCLMRARAQIAAENWNPAAASCFGAVWILKRGHVGQSDPPAAALGLIQQAIEALDPGDIDTAGQLAGRALGACMQAFLAPDKFAAVVRGD